MGGALALATIAEEVRGCTAWRVGATRTVAVPGEGNSLSDVLLVGEGPGFHEDRQGRPFVGPAGRLLEDLLASIGWERGDVFITNVVKCRPPGNRDPEPDEVGACAGYLRRQEVALDPAVVVTLGRHSLQPYLPGARIAAVHGTLQRAGARFVFAMYHPAAALHQGSLRETLFRDIRRLPAALVEARRQLESRLPVVSVDTTPRANEEQLTLF